VQDRGRVYRFPEVGTREEKHAIEHRVRETLKREGTVQETTSVTRVRREWDPEDRVHVVEPEKLLLLRVLERTSLDLRSSKPSRQRSARAWFESDDRSWLMSFASICEALGRDPDLLRRRFLGRDEGA
jgi:hypothetical protein